MSFDQPKTENMELQAEYTDEAKSEKTSLLRRLLLTQIELEKFSKTENDHLNEIENLIESIDQLFESVLEDDSKSKDGS